MQARYRPATPDQQIRDLRRDLKDLDKQAPSPERASRLAAFARSAHDARQLNMVMHTATLALDEDPDAPTLLVDAYTPADDLAPDETLRAWADLRDLGRYVDRPDIATLADDQLRRAAAQWLDSADEAELRHRYRWLASTFDRAFADEIRDSIG